MSEQVSKFLVFFQIFHWFLIPIFGMTFDQPDFYLKVMGIMGASSFLLNAIVLLWSKKGWFLGRWKVVKVQKTGYQIPVVFNLLVFIVYLVSILSFF